MSKAGENFESFGSFIRRKREENGFLLKDLAQRIGCTSVYLSEVELGRKAPPSQAKIDKIGKFLGIEGEFLRLLAIASKPSLVLDLEGKDHKYRRLAMTLTKLWDNLSEEQVSRIAHILEEV